MSFFYYELAHAVQPGAGDYDYSKYGYKVTDQINKGVWSITVFVSTFKLCQDLRVMAEFRKLVKSMFTIIRDIFPSILMVMIFMSSFAMVLYICKFYNNHPLYNECSADNPDKSTCQTRNFIWYLMWTYEYAFANWENPSPIEAHFIYMYLYHLLFTFIITIVMINTLIAIAGNTYAEVDDNFIRLDSIDKTDMIIESIDYMIQENRIINFIHRFFGEVAIQSVRKSKVPYFYLALKKREKTNTIKNTIKSTSQQMQEILAEIKQIEKNNHTLYKETDKLRETIRFDRN